MAKKFLTPLGLVGLASDPATGSEGQLYFNTTDDVVRVYANGAWTELSGAGGEGASVIYSASQPDITGLNVGTIWVDSDAVITGGGGGGGGTGGPSFQTIVTIPTSASVVAQTAGEILTLISGSNVYITNASANNSITIGVTGIQEQIDNLITSIGPSSASATASRITAYVKNGSTSLAKGTPVYVTGADGSNIIVGPASNISEPTSSKTLGFTQTALSANQHGYIVLEGTLSGLDTSLAGSAGDPIWLGETPGTVIYGLANKPKAPNNLVYLGVVSRKNSNNGEIFVKIQNGFELNELHDVRIISIQNDDLIVYNSASSIWVNSPKQNIINTASAAAVSYLVDGAPEALNTLNELSEALNDNADILDTLLTTTVASSTYLPLSSSASFYRWTKTYSASASVISGVDDNSISLSYNAGYIQLFINGVMLDPSEYTATSGSAITVSTPVLSGEVVDIFAFLNSTSVNTYSQAQIDNKYNNLTRWKKAYSASATVISGVDDNSNTLSYLSGYEQFYLNGILLTPITDYARTSASVVTLSTALISGDIVEIINTQPFNVADVYNTSQSDNRYLTQSSASTTYLTRSSASTTYLTQSSASSTYLTQANGITAATASATYIPQSSPVTSFKNKIINGGFDIWQRGTSFSTSNAYAADRWVIVGASGQTVSVSQQSFTPGAAPVSGYEGTFFARLAWSGTPSGSYWFTQRIENVRTFSGQTITLSFWAKATSNTSALTPMIEQNFGTGGSSVVSTAGSSISITTSWQRFTQTFVVPSISGKTIGTSSYLEIRPFSGSTAITGNSIDIWGVQVEKGSLATDFEERFIGNELQMCQRYYLQSQYSGIASHGYEDWSGFIDSGYTSNCFVNYRFPVEMRVAPTITVYSGNGDGWVDSHGRGQVGSGGVIVAGISRRGFQQIYHPSSSLGSSGQALRGGYRASAEL